MARGIARLQSARFAAVGALALAASLLGLLDVAALARSLIAAGGAGLAIVMLVSPVAVLAMAISGVARSQAHRAEMRQRLRAQRAATALAKRDPLTGLDNRRGLIEGMARLAAGADKRQTALGVMIIDLDNFKKVNDVHGHQVGDALIRRVGERIAACCPAGTLVARMGGDEFAVACEFARDSARVAETIAGSIVASLSRPVEVDGHELFVGASIGLAEAQDASAVPALLRQADLAMYRAKQSGRSCFCWFDRSMEDDLRQRTEVQKDLRLALPRGEIVPFYEPQVALDTGRVTGFEVLARWQHPQRGTLLPAQFIPLAEECGLISELSLTLLARALDDAAQWDDGLTLSINISAHQLRDPLFAQKVLKVLFEARFPAQRLELEITELALLGDMAIAKAVVASLKNQGVRLALDDFGTGYSSLQHLRALPFDRIKIDRSFIASIGESAESQSIVSTVLGLGRSLGIDVIAEGIETVEIEDSLRRLSCRFGQGWLYSKPLSGSEAHSLLHDSELHGTPLMAKLAG